MNTNDWSFPSPRRAQTGHTTAVPPDGSNPLGILSFGATPARSNSSGQQSPLSEEEVQKRDADIRRFVCMI